MAPHIGQEYLQNLHKYKYSVIDTSPFSKYVLQPYWNYMIRFVPWGIAPNLITLLGFFGLLLNYLVVAYFVPRMEGPAPAWVYLSSAFAIEWYSLLDNLDGRQARRTRTSSPLGELFDHGCDCLAVAVGACTASCIYQFGPHHSIIELVTMSAAFWLCSWEEYHTGTFYLGYFNGPTEGLKILLASYLWTWYAGPAFWYQGWKATLPMAQSWGSLLPECELRLICAYIFSLTPMFITFYYNIKSVVDYKRKEGQPLGPAVQHLLSFAFYFAMAITWYLNSMSLWDQYPHAVQMAVGIGFGEMSSRLILAHLCKMPYPFWQRPMLPLALITLNSVTRFVLNDTLVNEQMAMWAYLLFAYASAIIEEVTQFLGIRCLSIPKQQQHQH